MRSRLSTGSLALWAADRPRRVLAAWGLALVASLVVVSTLLSGALTTDTHFTSNPDSKRADALLKQHTGVADRATETVIVRSTTLTSSNPAFVAQVQRVRAHVTALGPAIVLGTSDAAHSLVSHDRHAIAFGVPMTGSQSDAQKHIDQLRTAVASAASPGYSTLITGPASIQHDFQATAKSDLSTGEGIGMPIALIILLLVFGALVAALLPTLLAVVAIVIALALTSLVGQAFQLSFFVVNMLTMMGLAVGIDYSLFIVSRFREERQAGRDKRDAIGVAGSTASRAVFFSGITVVVALVGMLIVPTTIFISLATGAILVVLVAVLAALTLLPAILSMLGDRVDRLQLPFLRGRQGRSRFWPAAVAAVTRRPWVSLGGTVALLLLAAVPYTQINTGAAGISTLSGNLPSKQGYVALQREFSVGNVAPAQLVIDRSPRDPQVQAGVRRLEAALRSEPVFGTPALTASPDGEIGILTIPVNAGSSSPAALDAVRQLRSDLVPRAFAGVGAETVVTGDTARDIDLFSITDRYLPIVIGVVLALSFLLLLIAFRSIVVPAMAIAMNLLSVGAAYGLLVLVTQKGYGAGLLGFQRVDTVESWIPLFLFSVLFGLSMDYHVLLLSRIKERYQQTHDTRDAVAHGIESSARLITGAALIMVAVFAGFAAGNLVMFQQMGFGLAVAVLVDATIVRTILVPATMTLLGSRNWYLPSFLGWLPRVDVEGAGAPEPIEA
jgi:RND superfamily putative drug exporter